MPKDDKKKGTDASKSDQKDPVTAKRVIGKGMTSLDSTQAPLKSSNGEPDYEAMTDHGEKTKSKSDSSKRN